MRRPSLTPDERRLLVEIAQDRSPALVDAVRALLEGERISSTDTAALRMAVGDELAATGIDPEYGAVNERGQRLDALIDKIGAVSGMYDDPS